MSLLNELVWSWEKGECATPKKIIETPRLRNTKNGGRAIIFFGVALFPQALPACSPVAVVRVARLLELLLVRDALLRSAR